MSKQLRVLIVEDSEDDAVLLTRELQKGGYKPIIERVDTPEAMQKSLSDKTWDVVVSDYIMPKFSGLDALKVLQKSELDVPFIVVSGKIGEDTAVEVMKAGAHDYIMKSNLKRLIPAIKRELAEFEVRQERKQVKEDLKQSYAELEEINKKLQDEISERRKAENEAIKTREHLQNVVDSATEIIISVDQNKRITTWNKTAEELTGYKNKEILNRSINKLPIFEHPQQMIDLIKNVYEEKRPGYSNIVALTKTNAKKILRVTGSTIKVDGKQEGGVLFIGKDITRDLEAHGKLLPGNSYFIPDKTNMSSIDLLIDMVRSGCQGCLVTRSSPEMIKSAHLPATIQVLLLSQEKMKEFENVSDLNTLLIKLKQFSTKNKDAVILLDGMHYLITHFPFEKIIETIYRINDFMSKNKSILLLRFDPALVDAKQLAVIENELHLLPSQKIEGLIIEDDVYDALRYIYEQNQSNALVSFKKIMARFKIAYSTAAKRLEILEEKGLIFTKRQGKLRTVYISEKGKTFLHKRVAA